MRARETKGGCASRCGCLVGGVKVQQFVHMRGGTATEAAIRQRRRRRRRRAQQQSRTRAPPCFSAHSTLVYRSHRITLLLAASTPRPRRPRSHTTHARARKGEQGGNKPGSSFSPLSRPFLFPPRGVRAAAANAARVRRTGPGIGRGLGAARVWLRDLRSARSGKKRTPRGGGGALPPPSLPPPQRPPPPAPEPKTTLRRLPLSPPFTRLRLRRQQGWRRNRCQRRRASPLGKSSCCSCRRSGPSQGCPRPRLCDAKPRRTPPLGATLLWGRCAGGAAEAQAARLGPSRWRATCGEFFVCLYHTSLIPLGFRSGGRTRKKEDEKERIQEGRPGNVAASPPCSCARFPP
jgi:hypothetical protein